MKGRKDGREKHMAKEEEMKEMNRREEFGEGRGKEGWERGGERQKQTARTHGRCCAYIFT